VPVKKAIRLKQTTFKASFINLRVVGVGGFAVVEVLPFDEEVVVPLTAMETIEGVARS